MTAVAPGTALPLPLHRYFWEYDATRLAPATAGPTIMLRLMESGDCDAIRWLRECYGDDALRDFLLRRRGRGFSFKRLRYWGLILRVPRPTVDGWIATLRSNPWYTRVRN